MPIITDLLSQPVIDTDWLVYPILGRQAITFFHGRSSIGKTPFALEVARSVSVGESETRFGLEVRSQGTVLYLEAETALRNILPRLHRLPEPIGEWYYEDFYVSGADIVNSRHPCMPRLQELSRKLCPDLVIWSSIRRFISGDLNKAETPVDAYKAMIGLFPQAGHLVIAHDNKDPKDESKAGNPDDAFTGSAAWVQQASLALHMVKRAGDSGTHSTIKITKSQLGMDKWSHKLHLDEDGTNWVPPLARRIALLWPQAPAGDRAQWVAEQLHIDRATVYRHRPH